MIATSDVEPVAGPWQVRPIRAIAQDLMDTTDAAGTRPCIVAVDGRSGSGKSTFAERLSGSVGGSVVVHSDDIAWWESFFEWDHLMAAGVLGPVRRGAAVRFRPPAWDRRGRPGAIEVPAAVPMLVIEGVGVSRRSLARWLDASVWIQSDVTEARRRGIERDGASAQAEAFWDDWERHEVRFLADDRPWERARFVICGTPEHLGIAHDAETQALVGRWPHGSWPT